jgi:LacI family repressor for deo operon, udp, cdd, tsx, nupC, and nupG
MAIGGIAMDQTTTAPARRDRATIEDVAAAAGVSVATVSRALRGLPNVAFSTREHVRRIADDLAYRADPAASRLATGRSRSIAVAVPMLNGWYFSQVIAGAEAVFTETGYDMIVLGVTGAAARSALLDSTASIHRRVDGLIVVDIPLSQNDVETLHDRGQRVVTIGATTTRFPSVGIDDVAVGELATRHLVELGHRRIGLIAGQPEDPLGFHVPDLRRAGYELALAAAGIPIDPALQLGGNFSVVGGRDAMAALLELAHPPTAVFAMSDEMAFGAMLALRQAGRSTPDDVALVGVDDHDLAMVVGLTTVRQAVADHGSRAARLIVAQLDGAPDRTVAPMRSEGAIELVVRETSLKP